MRTQHTKRPRSVLSYPAMAAVLIAALALANAGHLKSVVAGTGQQALSITASFAEGQSVSSIEAIELRLNRPLEKSEGRLAVFIGSLDLTSVFNLTGETLKFDAKLMALPLGESELTVYLISPSGEWKELTRFPVKVSNDKPSKQASSENPKNETAPAAVEQKNDEQSAKSPKNDNPEQPPKPDAQKGEQSKPEAIEKAPDSQKSEQSKPEATEKTPDSQKSEQSKPEATEKTPEQTSKDSKAKPEEAAPSPPAPEGTTPAKPNTDSKDGEKQQSNEQPPAGEKTEKTDAAAEAPAAGASQEAKPPVKKFGFEKLDFVPAITLTIKSQPAQSNFPAANRPERATFTDANITSSFKTELARGRFSSQTQFDFAGSSFQKEALRFGELGNDALNVDLASYLTQYQVGKVKSVVGHTSYGSNRHLINNFSTRGMTLAVPLSPRFDLSLAAMNGSAIVGFDNFFGLSRRRNQLLSGTLGIEFLPKRAGGFRLETAVMEGWLLPVSGFNQGVVNDAERSKGFGFRVLASDPKQRFRFEGGFSRSEFVNPSDAALNQGQQVVELKPIWKNAQYIDAAYDIFKEFAITKAKKLNLTFNFKHERVDPLYKSLGASTQADKITNEFLLNGSIGDITAQYAQQRLSDNLADIPSILKSNTHVNTFSVAVPLASLFANPAQPEQPAQPSALLPKVSYTFNRTYQFGAAVPVNGGFEIDPATVPDQISTNQGITADWQFKKWRLAYRTNHSFQNNRQNGNQNADLTNLTNGVTVGITPGPAVDLAFDFNAESAFDKLQSTTNRNFTVAPNVTWRVNKKMNLVSNVSFNFAGDVADIRNDRNINFDLQYSYQFAMEKDRWRKVGGQFSIKYTNTFARSQNIFAGVNDLRKNQTLFAQMSFTFF